MDRLGPGKAGYRDFSGLIRCPREPYMQQPNEVSLDTFAIVSSWSIRLTLRACSWLRTGTQECGLGYGLAHGLEFVRRSVG